ncbi:hypothetical protein NO932_11025 [Pelagibacterium sp. 26DY04]|uniref:hypothetical protein n=1 Tax=unclassified Pelagibacterium TaxID=2623280 RepID=UPI0028153F14|nr:MULTISPECIES: hypothetical protein [unclassified Pelagibacterium]WMT85468.1 hypothetical protein NO932_11025 [Pelagibacterium sp. 26DY04]WMT90226.1 hypothetical protein NO934_15735 [Pelagibacterium sp. H642]
MSDGAMSNFDIEGRLAAQRQVLAWLLERYVRSPEDLRDLKAHIDESIPPRDHQEDPGAVTTEGHAVATAAGIEIRSLLEPLEMKFGRGAAGSL